MNEEQIKIFLAVAKAGSFTKAEDSSHLSKQAMLKQINALEDELGVRLLSRSRTGTSLTQAGQLFQKGMQKISRDMDQLIRSCRETAGNENRLKVGNVEHQALLTPVTQAFSSRYPEIEVRHVIHPNHSGEWRVAEGIQDVAETFSLACRNNPGLLQKCGYRSLTTVPYMAAMRKSHPLSKKAAVSLSELTRYPTMIFPVMLEKSHLEQISQAFEKKSSMLIRRDDVDNQVQAAYDCLDSDKILITANPFIEGISELVKVPLDTGWHREYGILYRLPATQTIQKYIETAEEIYRGEHG